VAAQRNNLPVLHSYCNSFFVHAVHREFGSINVPLFDILPQISCGKVRDSRSSCTGDKKHTSLCQEQCFWANVVCFLKISVSLYRIMWWRGGAVVSISAYLVEIFQVLAMTLRRKSCSATCCKCSMKFSCQFMHLATYSSSSSTSLLSVRLLSDTVSLTTLNVY